MKFVGIVIALLGLVVAGAVGFAYSGLAPVSATASEPGLLRWLLRTSRESAVRRRAADISVPDLTSRDAVSAGAGAYRDMCVRCHGAPGAEPFTGARDMSPSPPDLTEVAAERDSAELFWAIKNGIRMTGMPAWGPTHPDDELWQIVAFVEELPTLSPDAYQQLARRGAGHAHTHAQATAEPMEPEGHGHADHAH